MLSNNTLSKATDINLGGLLSLIFSRQRMCVHHLLPLPDLWVWFTTGSSAPPLAIAPKCKTISRTEPCFAFARASCSPQQAGHLTLPCKVLFVPAVNPLTSTVRSCIQVTLGRWLPSLPAPSSSRGECGCSSGCDQGSSSTPPAKSKPCWLLYSKCGDLHYQWRRPGQSSVKLMVVLMFLDTSLLYVPLWRNELAFGGMTMCHSRSAKDRVRSVKRSLHFPIVGFYV